jgi:hypothetical protein
VTIEVRSKDDPYTVYAENEYNLGRDLSIFFYLSILSAGLAFIMVIVLIAQITFVVKKGKKKGYAREMS